jgi:hypothetical protein
MQVVVKLLVVLTCAACIPTSALATVQTYDQIGIDQAEYFVMEYPLELLFKDRGRRPDLDEMSTSHRRGYAAIWEVRGDKLYLRSLSASINGTPAVNQIFKGRTLPVRADWYSGEVHVVRGKRVEGSGYLKPKFERVEILTFKAGVLKERVIRLNAGIDDH